MCKILCFSFFLSVCLFCFSTGVADIKAWPWSDPEPPVTSRSRSRLMLVPNHWKIRECSKDESE